ncbi:MAG: fibronectin type III domain-containing protein [Nitrospira sp.]|nr:fibronectin type III domain-containing protein [Nitrospira sp.]
MIASLSTPTDETGAVGSGQSQGSDLADDGEEDPVITLSSMPDGVTANLTWGRPHEFNVTGYSVHYGIRPLEEPDSTEPSSEGGTSEEFSSEESHSEASNSCSQGESQAVGASRATISGLEPNTRYFFAIRAFNETESLCSNEVTVVTPSAQS